jgi:hypothetical protein
MFPRCHADGARVLAIPHWMVVVVVQAIKTWRCALQCQNLMRNPSKLMMAQQQLLCQAPAWEPLSPCSREFRHIQHLDCPAAAAAAAAATRLPEAGDGSHRPVSTDSGSPTRASRRLRDTHELRHLEAEEAHGAEGREGEHRILPPRCRTRRRGGGGTGPHHRGRNARSSNGCPRLQARHAWARPTTVSTYALPICAQCECGGGGGGGAPAPGAAAPRARAWPS